MRLLEEAHLYRRAMTVEQDERRHALDPAHADGPQVCDVGEAAASAFFDDSVRGDRPDARDL